MAGCSGVQREIWRQIETFASKILRDSRTAATIEIDQRHGSENISSDPPKRDRPRTGSLSAEGKYEACHPSQGDALQSFCGWKTIAADSLSRCSRSFSGHHR